MQRFSSTFQ